MSYQYKIGPAYASEPYESNKAVYLKVETKWEAGSVQNNQMCFGIWIELLIELWSGNRKQRC
jgi:hypothetical protein